MNLNPNSPSPPHVNTAMHIHQEIILATIPGASEHDRLLVVLRQAGVGSKIEIRQQSWGEGLGWFTQSSVCMEPHQVAELRGVLGVGRSPAATQRAPLPRAFSQPSQATWSPRVMHVDSA
jgi:hypothetical protein